jgi:CBS domain-containing membrane protein
MPVISKPFLALTAADLMTAPVVTLTQDMPLREAANFLAREQISGAPVIDSEGRCVGVLSATDFVHLAGDPEGLPEQSVGSLMTPDPVAVEAGAGIREVARAMLDAHIHRVGVVDGRRRLVGIVSSTDLLAAIAYAESGQ